MIERTNKIINKAIRDTKKLSNEYKIMSENNALRSSEIRKSLNEKSENVTHDKQRRKKHFEIIRNKLQ